MSNPVELWGLTAPKGEFRWKKPRSSCSATPDERTRIKLAATKLGMSMTQFMLDTIMEQVVSVEELEKKGAEK